MDLSDYELRMKKRAEQAAEAAQRRADSREQQEAQRQQQRDEWFNKFRIDPPAHLSERAKALWSEVHPSDVRSPERLALLTEALCALDRADAARQAIATEGMTTTTARSGVTHVHPLVKVERESRQQFGHLWNSLGLNKLEFQVPVELQRVHL